MGAMCPLDCKALEYRKAELLSPYLRDGLRRDLSGLCKMNASKASTLERSSVLRADFLRIPFTNMQYRTVYLP